MTLNTEETARFLIERIDTTTLHVSHVILGSKMAIAIESSEIVNLQKLIGREIEARIYCSNDLGEFPKARLIEYEEVDEETDPREAWTKWYNGLK